VPFHGRIVQEVMGPGQPRKRLDHFNPLVVAFSSLLKLVCQADLWFVRHLKPEFSNCSLNTPITEPCREF
jgi:hypothetical protein